MLNSYKKIFVAIPVFFIALFSFELRDYTGDDAYITFRHAKNLIELGEFVFNPGDRLLSTTSPLHGIMLALLSLFYGSSNIPVLAIVLSTGSMLLLCANIYFMLSKLGWWYAAITSLFFVTTQHWLYRFYPLESIMTLALNTTSINLVLHNQYWLAGIIAGLAIVARPDAVIVFLLVAMYILITRLKYVYDLLKFALPAFVVAFIWFAFAFVYYGSIFPNTLAAKSGFGSLTFVDSIWPKILQHLFLFQPWLSGLMVMLSVFGYFILFKQFSPLIILPTWGLLHTIGYTFIGIPYPFSWYYAPIILITIVTACIGGEVLYRYLIERLCDKKILKTTVTSFLLFFLVSLLIVSLKDMNTLISNYRIEYWAGARDSVYRQVSNWLKEHTSPTAKIAMTEVGTIGYFSDRYIIDFAGLVTYDLRDLPKSGSWIEGIEMLKPDYVIGVRNLPPSPELQDIDGYNIIKSFPKNNISNNFEDIVIYKRSDL